MTDEEFMREYTALGHAIQTGVAHELQLDYPTLCDQSPALAKALKHLRVGINLRARDHSALVHLLVEKGVITDGEYKERVLRELADEKRQYEEVLSARFKRQPGKE